MRAKLIAYVVACAAAASSPLVFADARRVRLEFPGWPSELDGRPLRRLADTPQEVAFYAGQPVRHARFSDGERIVLMSWADDEIGAFHLASVCFRAFGFKLGEPASRRGAGGRPERCLRVERDGLVQRVCEHIRDGQANVYESEAAWHVARFLGESGPPYVGVSIVEIAHAR